MLYEKNTIVEIKEENNKKGIYASFVCEEDNTYDYLLLEDINKIIFIPTFILSYKNTKHENVCISFSTEYDPSDPLNIKLIASANEIEVNDSTIELQTVVDNLCLSVYEMKEFGDYPEILYLKNKAIKSITSKLFSEQGILMNSDYDFIGRIIDKNNNIVGIIDSFSIDISDLSYVSIKLNNIVSYFSLKDIDVKSIEFPTGKYMLKFNDFEIIKSDNSFLKNYTLKTKLAIIEENTAQNLIKVDKNFIDDEESFFDNRAQLLTDKEEVFKENNTNNLVEDLFDDFDL